jgi:hypothetical protein
MSSSPRNKKTNHHHHNGKNGKKLTTTTTTALFPSIFYIITFIIFLISIGLYKKYQTLQRKGLPTTSTTTTTYTNILSPLHLSITIFAAVNFMICLWEMALYFQAHEVKQIYNQYKKSVPRGELPNPLFLFQPVSLIHALTFKHWAKVWGTYALLDLGYQDTSSFGWNADVGNGFSTVIQTGMLLYGSTDPLYYFNLSPRFFGFLMSIMLWQVLYGTIIYFFQYMVNKRYLDHNTTTGQFLALVVGTNGLWIIGPFVAMMVCWEWIKTDNANILLTM